jgi:hypothetical protein
VLNKATVAVVQFTYPLMMPYGMSERAMTHWIDGWRVARQPQRLCETRIE